MNDVDELAQRFVAVWNEPDPEERGRLIRSLWTEDGVECRKTAIARGHGELETRIAASHDKNVRAGGHIFRLRGADRNQDIVKLDWRMDLVRNGETRATGSYVLVLNDAEKIVGAYFFADS
jgi:hypothetical protein